ncbi:MAG: hypothetical protein VKJ64_08420, partial [Leptolyngbyaceae bacterium]|nr:hypothetical protein [Leptolyngbyaceae bacterium]
MNSYADLVNKILSLKQDIDSEYFSNPKIKRDLEEGIWYDFLLYDRLLRKYECQRHGAIYLGGHNGEMLLTLILLGFS